LQQKPNAATATLTGVDSTSRAVVGDQIRFINKILAHLIGPLGAAKLLPGEGLLLAAIFWRAYPGMPFSIYVVALNRSWLVRGMRALATLANPASGTRKPHSC
jgi:hypothetical protein